MLPDDSPQEFSVRRDPIHGWPVFYAPARAKRPFDFGSSESMTCGPDDPFAEGNEGVTVAESLAVRDPGTAPDSPGWQVRIIPNKYPALATIADPPAAAGSDGPELSAAGVHEVIVECPQRETHFSRLSDKQRFLVFQSMRDRLRQLEQDERLGHAVIFKNHGQSAGASLAHSHSQLMATQFVSPMVQREWTYCQTQAASQQGKHFADLLARERANQSRLVRETETVIALCPDASRFAFETHLFPLTDEAHFHNADEATLRDLSDCLTDVLRRIETLVGDFHYNLVLHTAPFRETAANGFRWHWEIYPRIAGIAGWELGAGGHVNALYPEVAAQMLRNAVR